METGTIFRVESLSSGENSIEMFCAGADATLVQGDMADVVLGSQPVAEGGAAVDITLKRYTIEYFPLDGGPDLQPHDYADILGTSYLVPGGGTLSLSVEMMPIQTKDEYIAAVTGTTNFGNVFLYRANYQFFGETKFGQNVETEGDVSFNVGNFVAQCE